jgi:gliding motility-associated-like protein
MRKLLLIISCFLYLSGAQAQIPSYVPKNGLVGWWPFTGNAKDSSGNGNHGTVNGAILTNDRFGKSNRAYSFNGTNNYIEAVCNSLPLGNSSRTFSAWIYLVPKSGYNDWYSFLSYGTGLGIANPGKLNDIFIGKAGSNLLYYANNEYGTTSNTTKDYSLSWHHMVVTYSGKLSDIKLYIDGVQYATTSFNYQSITNINTTLSNLFFGRTSEYYSGASQYYFFNGKIDDIGIWNRALDPCEIASLYQAKVVSPKPSSVSIGNNTQKYCGLDSVKLTATTGFKSYAWNTGKSGNTLYAKNTGVYSVAATDSQGCTVYDTAVVSIMNPKITPRDTVVCYPNIVSLSATSQAGALACNKPSGTLANGLVGWWPFCGNANDISGNGNHTSVYGPVLTKDRFGMQNGAYLFDGVNDYLEGKFNNFPLGASARSISGWVKFNSKTPKFLNFLASWGLGTPFSSTSFGTAFGFFVHGNMQSLQLWPSWTSTPFSNLKYNNNFDTINFYHLAVTYEVSGRFKFYINSKLVYTNTVADVNTVANNNIFRLGRSSHTNTDGWAGYLNGVLDDVGIWNRALTDNEILTLYGNDLKYTWSTADTVQKTTINLSGKSTVWVKTDNGIGTCYDTTTVTIQKPSVSLGVGDTLRLCGTDSVQLNATTGFKNYAWSNGKTGASAYVNKTGLISVSATDSLGCKAADTALVSIQNPRILPRDTVVCSGNPVTLKLKDTGSVQSSCGSMPAALKNGLVGWWPFCGNANDESGNGNNGIVNGAMLVKNRFGDVNSAYTFDGVDDYIKVENTPNILNKEYTVSIWFYSNTDYCPVNGAIIRSGDNVSCFWKGFAITNWNNTNNFGFSDYGGGGFTHASNQLCGNFNKNKWYNIVFTRNNTKAVQYINGIAVDSSTNANYEPATQCPIFIGSNHLDINGKPWNVFNGVVDDIGIWNRALTIKEVRSIFNDNGKLEINPKYTWSTGDTTTSTRIQTTGTTKVWVRSNNGIGSCYDTTTVGISNPKVNFASDTLRFTNCNRDSLKVSVGKGWKSVAWSNGKTDTAINLKTTGKYSVKVQDNVGCFAYDTTYFINPGKVKVTVVAIDSVNCFNGSDGSITASTMGGFTPITLAWNDPAKQNTNKAIGLKAGDYKVRATDIYGCVDSATATVLQPAKLTVTLSRMDSIRCYRFTDGSITVTATGGTLPLNYRWSTGAQNPKIDNLGAGVYKVVVSDAYGCRDSFSANLNDPPELIARIVAGNRAMKGESLNVSGIGTPNGNHTYSWQPASLFGTMSGSQNASIKLENNVTLKLTVTNKNGCLAKDSLDVEVIQPLKDIMPNAFSPNKDGLNEGFGIPDIFEVKDFYVYDRWGGIIFKGNASNPRWNGYVGNEPAPAGSYSYQITATLKGSTQDVSFTGKVALIK